MGENIKLAKQNFSKLGGSFVLGTFVIFAVQLLPSGIIQQVKPEWMQNGNFALIITLVPMYVIGMPFLIWLLKRLPASAPEYHRMSAGQFGVAAIICYALMYCSNIIGNIITFIVGLLKGGMVENTILNIAVSHNMLLTFIYMVILAPVFEEYIFRKLIVDRAVRYGQGVAVVLSGLMFGLFHGNLNQFAYAFVLGMFWAFLYVKTGNIKITIALHMIFNFIGGILGVLILKLLPLNEMAEASSSGDLAAVMEIFQSHMGAWIFYMLYMIVILTVVITGIILLIVFRKRFKLTEENTDLQEEDIIPKGRRFKTVILNPGMLAYCVFWLSMIVLQLFM